MSKAARPAVAQAQHRLPDRDAGAGRDPRLDRREGDRQGERAADDRRRLLQPPEDRHEARCRPDRHLPRHQGQAARAPDPQVRAQRRERLQHLSPSRACPTGRSPIPARRASRRCCTRRRPRRSISSPTAPAGMCSPTRWPSSKPMSRKWFALRRAAGADVSNRGIGRGRLFMGGLHPVRGRHRLGRSALMMSPHGEATVARGTEHVRDDRRGLHPQQRDRHARPVGAGRLAAVSGAAAAIKPGATG